MATAFSFAVPTTISQDLQLIQDILGDLPLVHIPQKAQQSLQEHTSSDDEHGTDSDTDSEKEVEADILGDVEGGDGYARDYFFPIFLLTKIVLHLSPRATQNPPVIPTQSPRKEKKLTHRRRDNDVRQMTMMTMANQQRLQRRTYGRRTSW